MLREIKDLPGALHDAKDDLHRASRSVVQAGEATQNAMIGVAVVAMIAIVISLATLVMVRRATA